MSREFLLDVNVLIALAWPPHEFHNRVQDWFARYARDGWATCPFTQNGFVRILTNPAFSPVALTPKGALQLLTPNLEHPNHHFWEENISFGEAVRPFGDRLTGHRQVPDAYLLGLVIHRRGKLATMDRRMSALLPNESPERQRIVFI